MEGWTDTNGSLTVVQQHSVHDTQRIIRVIRLATDKPPTLMGRLAGRFRAEAMGQMQDALQKADGGANLTMRRKSSLHLRH